MKQNDGKIYCKEQKACMKYLMIQNFPLLGHAEKLALQDGPNVGKL